MLNQYRLEKINKNKSFDFFKSNNFYIDYKNTDSVMNL